MAGVAGRGLAAGHVSSLRPVLVFVSLREVIGRSGSSSVTLPQAPPRAPCPPHTLQVPSTTPSTLSSELPSAPRGSTPGCLGARQDQGLVAALPLRFSILLVHAWPSSPPGTCVV